MDLQRLQPRLPTIQTWSRWFVEYVDEGDLEGVRVGFINISDSLRSTPADAVAMCEDPPVPTGHKGVDAALAAVVEFTLDYLGLPKPSWISTVTVPEEPFYIAANPGIRDLVEASTLPPFRRWNCYVPEEFFESV